MTSHPHSVDVYSRSVKCICPMVATTKQNGHRHIMQQVNTTCDILSSSFCLNGRYGDREKREKRLLKGLWLLRKINILSSSTLIFVKKSTSWDASVTIYLFSRTRRRAVDHYIKKGEKGVRTFTIPTHTPLSQPTNKHLCDKNRSGAYFCPNYL